MMSTLFWLSLVFLTLSSIGNVSALSCFRCDTGYNKAGVEVSPPCTAEKDAECSPESIANGTEPHCVTVAEKDGSLLWKACRSKEFIEEATGKSDDCKQVYWLDLAIGVDTKGPKAGFDIDTSSLVKYVICACKEDNCNSGDSIPFGAKNYVFPTTKKPEDNSNNPTTMTNGGGNNQNVSNSGALRSLSHLIFVFSAGMAIMTAFL